MAGGVFQSQNKLRPGAYIKFQGVPNSNAINGSRGIVTFAAPTSWGPEGELIKITVDEIYNVSFENKMGYNINDSKAKLIRAALANAHTLLLFRDMGGTKAAASLTVATNKTLTCTAKYAGTVGNSVSVKIEESGTKYAVKTYLGSTQKDVQIVSNINELVNNDFVDFSYTSAAAIANEVVATLLTGGTDGSITNANYVTYLGLLKAAEWDTLAAYKFGSSTFFNDSDIKEFIRMMREDKGVKVQAVMNNYAAADYEGIISTYGQGINFKDNVSLSGAEMVVWVAGATAGADITESNTYKVVQDSVSITNDVSEDNIESLIAQGYLIFSTRRNGDIVIEKDINTLVTMRSDVTAAFKENKVIRLLDAVANHIADEFEENFIGKVNNDDNGRALFKATINEYLTSLQASGAIINFNSDTDVLVEAGEQPEAYYSEIYIQPTYSVDKLYMVVNVR